MKSIFTQKIYAVNKVYNDESRGSKNKDLGNMQVAEKLMLLDLDCNGNWKALGFSIKLF